jgi:hypothetical protein
VEGLRRVRAISGSEIDSERRTLAAPSIDKLFESDLHEAVEQFP